MGDSDSADSAKNERNAANRMRFESLPAAGSPAYWAALEDRNPATRLDLEILVMCVRERMDAGQEEQAMQVFTVIEARTRGRLSKAVESRILPQAPMREQLIEDIRQECLIALWNEMKRPGPTFLTDGFWFKFGLLIQNEVKQQLLSQGYMTREGVANPTRVPQNQRDSLDRPIAEEDGRSLGEITPDGAEDLFSLAELEADVAEMLKSLTPEERLLLDNEQSGELTQRELGLRLGISERAVRDRLKKLQARLRAMRNPPDEAHGEEK